MVMTIASFFATIAAYIVQFGFFFGGGGDDDDGAGFFALILVSLVVYAISFFLLQALSRYREFAADRGSAIITGRPSALASALMKISGTMERIPSRTCARPPSWRPSTSSPGREEVDRQPLLHPPAAREAARRRWSASRPSCRAPA